MAYYSNNVSSEVKNLRSNWGMGFWHKGTEKMFRSYSQELLETS